MDYYDRQKELRQLAFIDESHPYEVDETGIYTDDNGKFFILTASGCSCWYGDFNEEEFDSFEALERSLIGDDRQYNPSLVGAQGLITEARANL